MVKKWEWGQHLCLDGESKDSEAQEQGSKPWIPWKNQIENDKKSNRVETKYEVAQGGN